MLTLNASVDNLDVEMKPLMKEIFLSTPNLNKESRVEMRRSITSVPLRQQGPGLPYSHIRSTSYNLSIYARRAMISAPIMENKGTIHNYEKANAYCLCRIPLILLFWVLLAHLCDIVK
jgi:hypothetical protein